MSRYERNFSTLSSICFDEKESTDWQQSEESLAIARRLTNEAANGKRRPFQIVIATDRFCPLGDIVDSMILSTEGTGLLQARYDGQPIVRFHLMLRGERSVEILQENDSHIQRLQNTGVKFTFEECNSSSGISELTNARECALQFIRNLPKDDNPIILWLDDDLAFDSLITQDGEVKLCSPWSFFHEVWRYHEMYPGVDIGLGDVTGAPPLPASSTLHTNLVDLNASISGTDSRTDIRRWSERDYYYDLSDHNRNSEPWSIPNLNLESEEILWNLLEVGTLARPLVVSNPSLTIQQDRYVRGGNTIVFNTRWLNEIDHPKIPRRGDSIWALMVRNQGGKLGHFPLPLRHIRDIRSEDWTSKDSLTNWLRRLEVDLIGASFQRWFADNNSLKSAEQILVERCKRQLDAFRTSIDLVELLPVEIRTVLADFINRGIEKTEGLISNPNAFESYHRCVTSQISKNIPKAVNWHCEAFCNYRCKFCYAGFDLQRKQPKISLDEGFGIIQDLAKQGVEKINFVGGEPMLHPHLNDWIKASKRHGMTTSIVSNGTNMTKQWLEDMRPYLDWLGLSVDASNDEIHAIMGRANAKDFSKGVSNHLQQCLRISNLANDLGYGIKLNTVVTSANKNDDMTDLVKEINPVRWKIFQVLKIDGENERSVLPLLVTDFEFEKYIKHHKESLKLTSVQVVPENNAAMLGTYAMIDSLGRVYTNLNGSYHYSKHTIQETGFLKCWDEVSIGFSHDAFDARGGEWDWESTMAVAL